MIAHAPLQTALSENAAAARAEVLVVEDSHALRELLAALLSASGYAVRQAADGVQALRSVDRRAPDIIVLDLWMPEMNGWEFLRRLRGLAPPEGATPVVVITADRSAVAGALPVDALLLKPFPPESLLQAIEEALD